MKHEPNNQPSEIKKAEDARRTELAMLYMLMEKYPSQAAERMRKLPHPPRAQRKTASL